MNQSQDDRNDDGNQNEISMALIHQDLNIIDSLEDSVFLESVDLDILNTLPAPVYELDDLQDEFFPTTSEPVSDVHRTVATVSDVHVFEAPVSDVSVAAVSDVHVFEAPVSDVYMSLEAVSDVHVFEAPVSDVHMSAEPGPSSGVRSNEPPPRQHNLYSSIDSDVMIDQSGLPIGGRRTRSQTHSLSSTSSTLMASSVTINKDKRQCPTCLKYYGKYYLPKHMKKCNKHI